MLKLALIGRTATGKDTIYLMISEYLHKEHGQFTKRLAFGDGMKLKFHQTFEDIPRYPKPNAHYISYGTHMRTIDPKIWVKALDKEYSKYQGAADNFIVTDCRNADEIQWAKDNGFTLVWVESDAMVRRNRALTRGDKDFPKESVAETDLNKLTGIPMFVNCYDNLKDLEHAVIKALHEGDFGPWLSKKDYQQPKQ